MKYFVLVKNVMEQIPSQFNQTTMEKHTHTHIQSGNLRQKTEGFLFIFVNVFLDPKLKNQVTEMAFLHIMQIE